MISAGLTRLYRFASAIRNPSLSIETDRLCSSEFFTLEDLRAVQLERARQFFEFANTYSPYYTAQFERTGFKPRQLTSMEDLKQLPTQEKSVLVEESRSIRSRYHFSRLFQAETSGTSGVALSFPRDEVWDSINRAHLARGYRRFGLSPADRNGYLWGFDIRGWRALKTRTLDILQNRFRLFEYSDHEIESFVRKLEGAQYIGGYSSMVYELAKAIVRLGLPMPKLKMVKGTSETILDVYHDASMKAFGRRITSEYGAAETGVIAFDCEHGSLHVNIEDIILETDDDGSVIVTNLASRSFPIIRYRLGDVIKLSDRACACGREHPIIDEVQGRKGGVALGVQRTYPALTFYYVFKNLAVSHAVLLNYRVLQRYKGVCTIYIEHLSSAQHASLLESELRKYFGDDMIFEIEYVAEFPRGRKKAQYFESLV